MATKSLGQLAYDAYWECQEWLDSYGVPVVSWESLTATEHVAWQSAGAAVAYAVRHAQHQRESADVAQEGG